MANEEKGVRELCNTPERMAEFRARYQVPDDVVLTLKAEDDLTEGPEDNILLPVTAISQAGIRFPLNPFLREVLHEIGASINNMTVNTLKILTTMESLGTMSPCHLPFTAFLVFTLLIGIPPMSSGICKDYPV